MNPIIGQYIELIETNLGRGLTTLERASVIVAIQQALPEGAEQTSSPSLLRTQVFSLDPDAITDKALNPAVIAEVSRQVGPGSVYGSEARSQPRALYATPPTPPTVAEQIAGDLDIDPAELAGMPAGVLKENITGERDDWGNLLVGEIDGVMQAWNAEIQAMVPAIFFDTGEEGPLPIGAEYLGINAPGDMVPTNLGAIEAKFAEDVAAYVQESQFEAEALGLGSSYQAPGWAPSYGEVEYGLPEYYPGDQWIDFATKSPEYQTQIQYALVDAGLMREADLAEGVWTIDAAKGIEVAMAEANATGGAKDWTQILEERASGLAAAEARRPSSGSGRRSPLAGRVLTIPAYKEPDLAQLEVEVINAMQNQLRREPTDWEMALLAERLNENYRGAYDSQVQALKQEFEAGNRGILAGGPTTVSGGEVQDVNPQARLIRQIQDRYAAEIDLNKDRATQRQDVSNVFSILTQTQRLLSGGAF